MRREEINKTLELYLPKIEFSSATTQIKRGEATFLSWDVKGAKEAILWKSSLLPEAPEPLNWPKISRLGEKVKLRDKAEIIPEDTTSYYLLAKGSLGLHGNRIVVEVMPDKKGELQTEIWRPQKQFLDRMEDRSHVGWIERPTKVLPSGASADFEVISKIAEKWHSGSTSPGINLSASMGVIFEDEFSTLSWAISNANCAEMSETFSKTGMTVDQAKVSGTKITGGGWGAGGMPPCALLLNGSVKVTGQAPFGSSYRRWWVTAHNTAGLSATSWRWIDVLSVPNFKGSSTPTRISGIRNALRTVDTMLRKGCIYNDAALDTTVAAFKNGHLKRTELWARLLAELQNIKLTTFNCKDVADKDWGGGHWGDYTNEIILDWSPSHTPYLEYVILHELVHKCGFNGDLLKFYSTADIENQAHAVSGACFP